MDRLERLTIIESIPFSVMGDLATEYIEYWSAKLDMDEVTFYKKLCYYISITLSKKLGDDDAVLINLLQDHGGLGGLSGEIVDWDEEDYEE